MTLRADFLVQMFECKLPEMCIVTASVQNILTPASREVSRHDSWGPRRRWVTHAAITPCRHDAQGPGEETAPVKGQGTGFWPVLAEQPVDAGVKTKPFASGASIHRQDGEIRNTLSA